MRAHEDDALILCVARLGKEKNLDLLVDAFARLRGAATLVIVGDGPERRALEGRARDYGISSRVRLLGMLDRDQLATVYQSVDVFAFPSVSETQGLVIAEALYAELPVVIADTPQGREMVDGSDARLAAANVDEFHQALEEALASASTPEARAARKRTGSRYDSRVTTGQMAALYTELIMGSAGTNESC